VLKNSSVNKLLFKKTSGLFCDKIKNHNRSDQMFAQEELTDNYGTNKIDKGIFSPLDFQHSFNTYRHFIQVDRADVN